MKSQLLLAICLLFSASLFAQVPTNGLVAYYPFSGNANDASSNNRNGTISGGVTLTTDRFGVANQAYAFNGSLGSKITVSNWNILTGNAPRTMMIWFKIKAVNPIRYNMFLTWGTNQFHATSSLGTMADNTIDGQKFLGFFGYGDNLFVTEQLQYYDDRWHLIAATFDGNNLSLYLDGAFMSSKITTLSTGSSTLIIGNSRFDNELFDVSMNGSLDEVRIYNRALTTTEVQQIYQAEAPVPSAEFAKIGSNRFIHTVGQFNTSVGNMAGNAITNSAGTRNTFMGYQTGKDNSTGSYNTFMGYQAGFATTTGSNNVFVGSNANPVGPNAITLQNSVALGANAKVVISDAIVLGDTVNTNIKVGIGTAAPRYPLDVKGNINIRKIGNTPGRLIFASRSSISTDEQEYLVLTGGKAGESGLRLGNLTNQAASVGVAGQFLSVDGQGRVGLYGPTVSARQVRLQVANPCEWADHVFAADYPLPSLKAVGQYIQTNGHLPHLPSAQTMTEQGATVEELVKGLVKTQEEQTRYLLQLQADNEQLRKENAEIRALLKQVLEKK